MTGLAFQSNILPVKWRTNGNDYRTGGREDGWKVDAELSRIWWKLKAELMPP